MSTHSDPLLEIRIQPVGKGRIPSSSALLSTLCASVVCCLTTGVLLPFIVCVPLACSQVLVAIGCHIHLRFLTICPFMNSVGLCARWFNCSSTIGLSLFIELCIPTCWLHIPGQYLKFAITSVQQLSSLCLCRSNYTAYMCWTQLHLHMHCHILWVSHTSDMKITCYLHSIPEEGCLLQHSIIPTNAVLSHFILKSFSYTQWVKCLYYTILLRWSGQGPHVGRW